jgi:hypothetical protein
MKTYGFLSLSIMIMYIACMAADVAADTLHLDNGYAVNGKIDDEGSTDDTYVVRIGATGLLRIRRAQVTSIERNALDDGARPDAAEGAPVPAAARELVQVRLKADAVYGNGGILYGARLKSPDEKTVVIETPGAGITRISRDAIEKVEPYRAVAAGGAPVPTAAGAAVVRTTHRVHLTNGRVLAGNVVDEAGSAVLTVEIEGLGRLLIERRRVQSIEEAPGEISIPPEPAAAPPPLLGPRAEKAPPVEPPAEVAIDPALEEEILQHVEELGRWRARNRTRAEEALRRIGAPAVPDLAGLVTHPFELTRRAAMRLARDARSPAGIPLAIDGLLDEDEWVRALADEALRAITRKDLGFPPRGSLDARLEGHRRWLDYYFESIADVRE